MSEYYATNDRISRFPIEGGVSITREQYQEALSKIPEGKVISVDNGFQMIDPPEPPQPTEYWLTAKDKRYTQVGERVPANGTTTPPPSIHHELIDGEWVENVESVTQDARKNKRIEIQLHALSLMQARIPAIDSFEMVGLLEVLWPALSNPESQPDLAYCRDVYVLAKQRLDQLSTADLVTIEGYVASEDPNWP